LRGPQHDCAWVDELASFRYPDAWDQLMFGLRLGADPRCIATTTPRPTKLIKDLIERAKYPNDVRLVRGSTYENRGNLPAVFFDKIIKRYEGTRLGRQELNAEVLDDVQGALWTYAMFDQRVTKCPPLLRIVVAIDPSVADPSDSNGENNEAGIIVVGLGADQHGYVLDDLSGEYSPFQWAQVAIAAFKQQKADCIIAEVNNGGALVEVNLRAIDKNIPYRAVHASQGKRARAEPVSSLYQQGRVHHVGSFPKLEDQLANWEPLSGKKSPDRMDALVWGLTELMLNVDDGTSGMPKTSGVRGGSYRFTGSQRGF
jgi:phage terminase large subunit-like protein